MVEEKSLEEDEIRKLVREQYGQVAESRQTTSSCCGPASARGVKNQAAGSCGTNSNTCSPIRIPAEKLGEFMEKYSSQLGYSEEDLRIVPAGANLGLGCGNPTAHASIKEGETVIDLGSGGGFDCFIASSKVGKTGKVIGVDMTYQMIDKARTNAKKGNYENVEFRLGEIEHLPIADNTGDLLISNCVINLAPDKGKVFNESFRVLKPGGRMMISDIVLLEELPEDIKKSVEAYTGCLAGAILKDKYLGLIKEAGFQDIEVTENIGPSAIDLLLEDPETKAILEERDPNLENLKKLDKMASLSIQINAIKPK